MKIATEEAFKATKHLKEIEMHRNIVQSIRTIFVQKQKETILLREVLDRLMSNRNYTGRFDSRVDLTKVIKTLTAIFPKFIRFSFVENSRPKLYTLKANLSEWGQHCAMNNAIKEWFQRV